MRAEAVDGCNWLKLDKNCISVLKILRSLQSGKCEKRSCNAEISDCFQLCSHCVAEMDRAIASSELRQIILPSTSLSPDQDQNHNDNKTAISSNHECTESYNKIQLFVKLLSSTLSLSSSTLRGDGDGETSNQDEINEILEIQYFDGSGSTSSLIPTSTNENSEIEISEETNSVANSVHISKGEAVLKREVPDRPFLAVPFITSSTHQETLHDHPYNAFLPEQCGQQQQQPVILQTHSSNASSSESFQSFWPTGHFMTDPTTGNDLFVTYHYQAESDPDPALVVTLDIPQFQAQSSSSSSSVNAYQHSNSFQGLIPISNVNQSEVYDNNDDNNDAAIGQEIEINLNCNEDFMDQDSLYQSLPFESVIQEPLSLILGSELPQLTVAKGSKKQRRANPKLEQQHTQPSPAIVSVADTGSFNLPQNSFHVCPVCSIALRSKYAVRKHKSSHSGEVDVKCKHCNKPFFYSEQHKLTSHETKCAIMNAKPKFKCPICSKEYFSKESVRRHHKTHSGIKPFKCEKCGNAYFEHYDLKKHQMKYANQPTCGSNKFREANSTAVNKDASLNATNDKAVTSMTSTVPIVPVVTMATATTTTLVAAPTSNEMILPDSTDNYTSEIPRRKPKQRRK